MFGIRFSVLLVASAGGFAGLAIAADIDPVALLNQVSTKVRQNTESIPRFVCRQQLERWDYSSPGNSGSCREIADNEAERRKTLLRGSDRAKLDVMLSSKSELFAWPGSPSFAAETPSVLLGGGFSGSGDFAGFIMAVFGGASSTKIEYVGPCETGTCVRYRFDVPKAVSKYALRTSTGEAIVGFHGTFDVNPEKADLLSLTVIPTDVHKVLDVACDLRSRMTYTTAPVAAGVYTIPESTEKLYLADDGSFFRNRIVYEGCREYKTESVISFDAEDTPEGEAAKNAAIVLPRAGTRIELALAGTINSQNASAGDAIEGRLAHAVRDKEGHTLSQNTVFRGHIMQMEHAYGSPRTVLMTLRFDSMVLNGSAINVLVNPTGPVDRNGNQVYRFIGQEFTLDSRFVSKWSFGGAAK